MLLKKNYIHTPVFTGEGKNNYSAMRVKIIGISLLAIMLSACANFSLKKEGKKSKTLVKEEKEIPPYVPSPMPYQAAKTKETDLVHTKLDVSFSWEKRYLFGEAELTLQPHFFASDSVIIDAKGFDIHQVSLVTQDTTKELSYTYQDSLQLFVQLDKEYKRGEKYKVYIKYTAKPDELDIKSGSAAISDDKGLYFINPDGTEDKPRQIWTQGETEASSCWFPTIDRPNEKTTQEISITVDTIFVTISNGELQSQVLNEDGTRTDYWVQSKAHAPYLFMMAIGEFTKIQDKWMAPIRNEELQVDYYVEKDYAQYAMKIFGNTPEMLGFFSKKLGYEYPWDKYAQVIVRDYVSGAMENTSASIFMDALQLTDRELLDKNWDYIIAHELFHHWFGDLVTCESWSNLALNESFANYSEYLWYEYKYGREYADHHREDELKGYLRQASREQYPIVRYNYNHRMEMFDAHSYNKGGLVLHMLRKYLGEDAFFESLKKYLHDNEFTDAEIHELRMAFEEVTGQDLNWFFDQWFLKPGHPALEVTHLYKNDTLFVEVKQKQDSLYTPFFRIPTDLEIGSSNGVKRLPITIDGYITNYTFALPEKPSYVLLDAEQSILGVIKHEKPYQEYITQYEESPRYQARYDALEGLVNSFATANFGLSQEKPQVIDGDTLSLQDLGLVRNQILEVLISALDDPSEHIRAYTLLLLKGYNKEPLNIELQKKYQTMYLSDAASSVRAGTIANLTSIYDKEQENELTNQTFEKALSDSSYLVLGEAMLAYVTLELDGAKEMVEKYKSSNKVNLLKAVAKYYVLQKDSTEFDWTKDIFEKVKPGDRISLIQTMSDLSKILIESDQQKILNLFHDWGVNHEDLRTRYACYRILHKLDNILNARALREEVISKEKSTMLQGVYARWESSISKNESKSK